MLTWSQRGFALLEPNGLVIFLYAPIGEARAEAEGAPR